MVKPEEEVKMTIREFFGGKQSHLFQTLKQSQFTGKLILTSNRQEEKWYFYICWGRILYATGGEHPVRRWLRHLYLHAPNLRSQLPEIEPEVFSNVDFQECWEYYLLRFWLEKNQLSHQQVNQIIRGIIVEILFDMSHTMEISSALNSSCRLQKQLALLDADQLITQSWQQWQNWQGAKLADRSPNRSPLIYKPEQLKQHTSPKTYKIMEKLFNGEKSLRDLSLQLQQDLVLMTKLMIPYLQLGLINLVRIYDLPIPWLNSMPKNYSPQKEEKMTIACVSHESSLVQEINKLVTQQGYKFVSYNHSQLALSSMLANPPQFIFIDFDLKDINVYEFSSQLRSLYLFSDIPIIVMASNLNILSKWRNKMSGGNDFLLKPINEDSFNQVIKKYLTKLDKKTE